jgi:hypothetical protein
MTQAKTVKWMTLIASLALAVIWACAATNSEMSGRAPSNGWLSNAICDAAIRNAIIAQRTIFPYHFEPDAATLNELGQRDLEVLTAHFQTQPGQLSVRRGKVAPELYDRRVRTVLEALVATGIDEARIAVSDAPPQGDGLPSEQVLRILQQGARKTTAPSGGLDAAATGVGLTS